MEELRGQSYFNYKYGKILSVLDKKWILLKKYNEELIRPIKIRCFIFAFYQIIGITRAFTSSETSFFIPKNTNTIKAYSIKFIFVHFIAVLLRLL